jgi:hypothetical protein
MKCLKLAIPSVDVTSPDSVGIATTLAMDGANDPPQVKKAQSPKL